MYPEIKLAMDEYIDRFGDRCVGELKLETISYKQDPLLLVKLIQTYVKQEITSERAQSNIEEELRINAENKIYDALKGSPLKKWWFNFILNKTRDLVSNRENLRYERTRGFGMVRTMFSALGIQWEKSGYLDDSRDIFYLKLDEILRMSDGSSNPVTKDDIVDEKKNSVCTKNRNHRKNASLVMG